MFIEGARALGSRIYELPRKHRIISRVKPLRWAAGAVVAAFPAVACASPAPQEPPQPREIVVVVTATPTEIPTPLPATSTPEPATATPEPPTVTPAPARREQPPVVPTQAESTGPFATGMNYRGSIFEFLGQPEGEIVVGFVPTGRAFGFAVRQAVCADGGTQQIVGSILIDPASITSSPNRNFFSQTDRFGNVFSAAANPQGQLAGEVIFRDVPPTPDTAACKGKKLFFQAVLEQVRGRSGLGKIIGDLYQRIRKGDNPPETYIKLAQQYCACEIPAESQ
ncbi:hypothetical protein HYU96_00220 [Candidatus Daviesbacteria bacterium]|nr:hypothetical protein [Candidatus Daviesbacteria bacterium]